MSKRRYQLTHTQRAANVSIITERGIGLQFIVPEEAGKLLVFVLRYVTLMWAMAYIWRGYEWAMRQVVFWTDIEGWERDLALTSIAALSWFGLANELDYETAFNYYGIRH